MPIKTLGSLGKIRVGRVTGNTHIFFFGLRRVKLKLGILAKDIALCKSYVFLLRLDKNSGCYGNL